jgi:hypothetical protein
MRSYSWQQYVQASASESVTVPPLEDCLTTLDAGEYEFLASHIIFPRRSKTQGLHLIGTLPDDSGGVYRLWLPVYKSDSSVGQLLLRARTPEGGPVRLRITVTNGRIDLPVVERISHLSSS